MEWTALAFAIGVLLGLVFGPSKEHREATYAKGFAAGLVAGRNIPKGNTP